MILFVYCAGGLGKEVVDLAEEINREKHCFKKIQFVDDVYEEKEFYHHSVLRFEEICKIAKEEKVEVAIANGEPDVRKTLFEKCKKAGLKLATLVHPQAMLSGTATLGEGVIIKGASSISSDVVIGDNVYIQPHATVGHDSVVLEHSVISCFVSVPGKCRIASCVYLGTGAVLKDGISVGAYAIVGIGSVVFRNVRAKKIVVGNPARRVGDNEQKSVFHRFD